MKRVNSIKKISKKSGIVMTEAVLLIGISLVIIITIFFPQIKKLLNDTIYMISEWFKSTLGDIGI